MQALPPPPPVQCLKTQDAAKADITAVLVASGNPDQLAAWLEEVRQRDRFKVDAEAQSKGVAFARLRGDGRMPYREIGGLIYAAQARGLSISFQLMPPICGAEDE